MSLRLTDGELVAEIDKWLDGKTEARHVSHAIAEAQLEKMTKWLIDNNLLCPKEEALRVGCFACKRFWEEYE